MGGGLGFLGTEEEATGTTSSFSHYNKKVECITYFPQLQREKGRTGVGVGDVGLFEVRHRQGTFSRSIMPRI